MDFGEVKEFVKVRFVYFLLLSILSGVLAGMGMGGGTLLIPILIVVMGVEQQIAQATNLLVFIPCSIIACIIYAKNKMVDFKGGWLISLVASLISIVAVIVAVRLENETLSTMFGIFLIVLGVVQFVVQLIKAKKSVLGYVKKKEI